MSYVAERIEPAPSKEDLEKEGAQLKPEEYLELYCQNQVSRSTALRCINMRVYADRGTSFLNPP